MTTHADLNMIAMIGKSDQPCWLAEAYKTHLLLLLTLSTFLILQEEKHSLLGKLRQAASHSGDATDPLQAAQPDQRALMQAEPAHSAAQQATPADNVADAPKQKGKQGICC